MSFLALKNLISQEMKYQNFDSIAVSVVDFKQKQFQTFELNPDDEKYFYDLASLTKALTNSVVKIRDPKLFDFKMDLLLNHRGGLPSGGRLSNRGWREFLKTYQIIESETLYSDYSSLRLMIEIEEKSKKKLKDLCDFYFDQELVHWLDLPKDGKTPQTGYRNKKIITREVHDDNCFNLKSFVSHAGLFATIGGLSKSLLNLNKELDLIATMNDKFKSQPSDQRFIDGFDRPMNLEETLAGKGCSKETFGHLGFTGTSFWIDCNQMKASIILTNATQNYWHERSGLVSLRKKIGEAIWKI